MQLGEFRADLFHRLNVVPLILPALRKRKLDIPLLIDYFFEKIKPGQSYQIDRTFYDLLGAYHWPGNIRELENLVERLVATVPGQRIAAADVPPHFGAGNTTELMQEKKASNLSLDAVQRNAIEAALQKTGGNQTRAAELLNIPRHVLIYRMKKLDIR